jgi:hypothetical protein
MQMQNFLSIWKNLLIKQIDDENKEMYILGDLNCNLLGKKTLFNMQIPVDK